MPVYVSLKCGYVYHEHAFMTLCVRVLDMFNCVDIWIDLCSSLVMI